MIPEIGHLALILALAMALIQFLWPLYGIVAHRPAYQRVAAPAAVGQFLMLGTAFVALAWSFYVNDFSVVYVAENSNTHLPWFYRLGAVWGAHSGSLLLWMVLLSVWSLAVALASRSIPREVSSGVLSIMGFVSIGFLCFSLTVSDPFIRQFPAPGQGRNLDPLLQDPGLVFHPPMLYMGYVGFSVAFAFAITALITGRVDAAWTRWTRPWTLAAWMFLTLGITLGSMWSYNVLGWGGWWFWDPVENASFMPWLVGTALIHSLAVTEKRGIFQSWTVLLAITAFALCLLGTFLVRSGVLVSVHSFSQSPGRGIYLLCFFAVVIGLSLLLYAIRAPRFASNSEPVAVLSREGLLLMNNLFLVVAAAAVLIGTLYPIFASALGFGRISVGPPYFNSVFVPLTVPLVIFIGAGAAMAWKRTRSETLTSRLWIPAIAAIVVGIVMPALTSGLHVVGAVAGCVLGCWAIATAIEEIVRRTRGTRIKLPRQILGMALAHIGVGIFVIGVSLDTGFGGERDARMAAGQTLHFDGYAVLFKGAKQEPGPDYTAKVGTFVINRNGAEIGVVHPSRRSYINSDVQVSQPGVDHKVFGDFYVSMGDPLPDNGWSVRVYNRPYVSWIFGGGFLAAIGGLLALSDKRYWRRRVRERTPRVEDRPTPHRVGRTDEVEA